MNIRRTNINTEKLVLASILTAIVVVLQVMALVTRLVLPMFAINLVLIPIVIGAAIGGVWLGAWLGFVSSVAILCTDAAAFFAVSIIGTILTVLVKGVASGLAAAGVYKLLEKKNKYAAVICAAVVCPIVNTGVFILGCLTFFMDTIKGWGAGLGYDNAFVYIIVGMIGINFIIELVLNVILSPTALKLIEIRNRKKNAQ
jgi:hypothetical protein